MATVDFSDVVTYDGAAILAQASFSAAENSEPTPTERLWELVTNAVAFLADHYGADRDEFIPSVLALAMPTLLECKTPLNLEGQMDLVEQGIWGRPFRGQQVFGIRDAARKVARGDYDEWMMSAWVETDEGDPVGVIDGLIEGLNFWDSDVAADLEYRALEEIEALIARAQKLESEAVKDDAEDALKVAAEIRAHADEIKMTLDEYRAWVPSDEKPTPAWTYEPQRSDDLDTRIAEAMLASFLNQNPKAGPFQSILRRVLVEGGEFTKAEKGIEKAVKRHKLDKRIKAAREASSTDAGFQQIELEARAAEQMAEAIVSAEAYNDQPLYLQPEYPFDYENVSYALSQVTMHTDVVERLRGVTEVVRVARREMKEAFSEAWNAPQWEKTALWDRYRALKDRYQQVRDQALEEMVRVIPDGFTTDLSPTESAASCNALAGEVGLYYNLVREAAAEALDLDVEDEDVWGRLYPEGNLGDEYESLLPGADRGAVGAFLELVGERVPVEDLTYEYWDAAASRKAHVRAALGRASWQVAAQEGRAAYWALPKDQRKVFLDANRKALAAHGLRRAKVNGRWQVVDKSGQVVSMEQRREMQAKLDVQVIPVVALKTSGVSDGNGTFVSWNKLAGGLGRSFELQFESNEKRASFVNVVAGLQDANARRVAQMLQ